MGLPVPAKSARVGLVESLHILAKAGGTQSAGALEQTLVELAEVVSDPSAKLILADELEAITEPGAGARIIAGMLLAAESQPETTMMLVTHLAPAIIKASGRDDLRVDGIEASGLDEDMELIVDRTPKRRKLSSVSELFKNYSFYFIKINRLLWKQKIIFKLSLVERINLKTTHYMLLL
jgi:hypothetical protein